SRQSSGQYQPFVRLRRPRSSCLINPDLGDGRFGFLLAVSYRRPEPKSEAALRDRGHEYEGQRHRQVSV
ncbi:unnamed protein product, partial [Amoebophrya sp. A120]